MCVHAQEHAIDGAAVLGSVGTALRVHQQRRLQRRQPVPALVLHSVFKSARGVPALSTLSQQHLQGANYRV